MLHNSYKAHVETQFVYLLNRTICPPPPPTPGRKRSNVLIIASNHSKQVSAKYVQISNGTSNVLSLRFNACFTLHHENVRWHDLGGNRHSILPLQFPRAVLVDETLVVRYQSWDVGHAVRLGVEIVLVERANPWQQLHVLVIAEVHIVSSGVPRVETMVPVETRCQQETRG